MERNFPVIPILRNFRYTAQNFGMKFRKISVPIAPQPGISGIFGRMESAQGNPIARVTLARGLKDSPGLQAKFSGRVTLLPETTLRLLRIGNLASKARTNNNSFPTQKCDNCERT